MAAISRIRVGLSQLILGQNQRLSYQHRDELGDLVDAYNQALSDLDASVERLKQSEREMAWREMARQVAHEIKNPLTPMRLSVQHLQRAQKLSPADTPELVERMSKTLLEQIDTLTRIADAFSNYAQMPSPASIRSSRRPWCTINPPRHFAPSSFAMARRLRASVLSA